MRTHLTGLAAMAIAVLGLTVSGHAGPVSGADFGRFPGAAGAGVPIIKVQADQRMSGLEEEIRRLNGKVEELNFMIFQLQDQVRRMQEDNEFRFQELEGGNAKPDAAGKRTEAPAMPGQADHGQETSVAGVDPRQPEAGTGAPARPLGSITFDAQGRVVADGAAPAEAFSPPVAGQGQDAGAAPNADQRIAALPATSSPEEAYQNSYNFLMAGDYRSAEAGFRSFIESYPNDQRIADATFWQGDALLHQSRYKEAAEIFLKANKDFPDAPKAPEMLLNLGVSLAGMGGQKKIACSTFDEVATRYPSLSAGLKERLKRERASAGC